MNMYNKKTIIRSLSLVSRRDFFVVTNTAFGDAPSTHTLGDDDSRRRKGKFCLPKQETVDIIQDTRLYQQHSTTKKPKGVFVFFVQKSKKGGKNYGFWHGVLR